MQFSTILVVEDHEAVRRSLCLELEGRAEFRVVGEAADGLEAVRQARDLQPDLILIDIGLPKLNGLEAARQIRDLAPRSKLVFISMESSPDVVREAFRAGASGYVCKLRAQSDLLPTLEAVAAGKQLASTDGRPSTFRGPSHHEVQFHFDEAGYVKGVTRFIGAALNAGNPAIVIATKPHREAIHESLKEAAFDLDAAIHRGCFISLDAADTLSRIMVNGSPDRDRFLNGVTGLVDTASKAANAADPTIAIFGECVSLLTREKNVDAAIQLEQVGNDLVKTHNVSILCAYPLNGFRRDEDNRAFARVCAEHSTVHFR